ncbi:MAG: Nucleoid-associated protein YbaB [Proteobacteria bacterium]|jgi:DNA-binding YbaB/EbfC family protein|nr:MAG: Nucleoid-associated protein YbaB [Pseudomonadota bacterium]|tara:strand:- start:728 stop:1036 length:309 start_codon:yes stop_codon:yes gene_type:complete
MVGMGDMMGMMKKAKQMQKDMEKMQKDLEKVEMSSTIADMVTVTVSGKGDMKALKIEDSAMADKETLEDMILAAFNDAKDKANAHTEAEMKKITGGINIPGF